jgi:hypothetical protein
MFHMLLICYDPTIAPIASEQALQPEHAKLEQELRAAGTYVSGAGLWPLETAKTVRRRDGKANMTDGPFAETKEAVGGYYIVECDENEAVAIAARIPVESRSWIEVRKIALFHPNVSRIAQMTDAG